MHARRFIIEKINLLEIYAEKLDGIGVSVGEQLIDWLASWLHIEPSNLHTREVQVWAHREIGLTLE